jgi:5,10-methylenetetrahydrofolate reductase
MVKPGKAAGTDADLFGRGLQPDRFVFLYGTTPPRADASDEQVSRAAERLAERVGALPLDGLVVYDIQDELGRVATPRPFPFLRTIDPRAYSRRLATLTGEPIVTYKCVTDITETSWTSWLTETRRDYGISHLSLVGRSSSRDVPRTMPLLRAVELAAAHPAHFTLGAVAIAERHGTGRSESLRMVQKATAGCSFFISQAVYDARTTIGLLADYARECAAQGVAPRRVILTFVPCGRAKTLEFIRWLGITMDDDTARAILATQIRFGDRYRSAGITSVPSSVRITSARYRWG